MSLGAKLRSLVERELVTGLARRRRRAVIERVRGNAEARREWDRALSAFRVLEQREVSRFEVEQVERWLFEDLELGPSDAGARSRGHRWTYLGGALATLASAAALVLWVGREGSSEVDVDRGLALEGDEGVEAGELVARGDHDWPRPLALAVLCGAPPRPATRGGCAHDELLGFSARLATDVLSPEAAAAWTRASERGAALTLFGIDERGELLYYAPTPVEPEPDLALRVDGGWTALPMSVRLEVNHAPGKVHVFALAGARYPSPSELAAWAEALDGDALAEIGVDDPPWHLRLDPAALAGVCPRPERCASAEAEFFIRTPEGPR